MGFDQPLAEWVEGFWGEGTMGADPSGNRDIPYSLFSLRKLRIFSIIFPLFLADGQDDGFHRPGVGHVDPGAGVQLGSVKEAFKHLLVFLAQCPPERLRSFLFGFQDVAIRHNCSAHFHLPDIWGNYQVVPLRFLRDFRIPII